MKRCRISEEQIIGILKENEDRVSVVDLCRMHGVRDASIYKWKARFGGLEVSEARRLRALEDKIGLPKRMLANAMLNNVAFKDLVEEKWCRPLPSGKLSPIWWLTTGEANRRRVMPSAVAA